MAPTAELTASKLAVAYGSAWQSPTSKAIRTPCTADSRRAVRIMPGARSWAVTVAPRAAASSATRPVPVATSSQRSPGCGSSAETRCSCIAGMPVAISKTRSYASPSRRSPSPTVTTVPLDATLPACVPEIERLGWVAELHTLDEQQAAMRSQSATATKEGTRWASWS